MGLYNINRILFITLSNIGDVVLTLPVLSALRDHFPDADIDILVGPRPKDIFKKDPRVKEVFVYNKYASLKEKLEFLRGLKEKRYDLAVDMRGSIMPLIIGARYRTGLFSLRNTKLKHKRDIHFDKIRPFKIGWTAKKNIYVDADDRQRIKSLLEEMGVAENDKLIGINPWSRSLLKRWDMQYLIESIKEILKHKDVKVVLMGDAVESGLSKEIVESVQDNKVIDLTGKTSLNELFALIDRLFLLLTCDSAGMHIACDLGIRVIAIFGPTDPLEYGPTGKDDIVMRRIGLKCSPCKKAVCRHTHECMRGIKPQEVVEAVKKCFS